MQGWEMVTIDLVPGGSMGQPSVNTSSCMPNLGLLLNAKYSSKKNDLKNKRSGKAGRLQATRAQSLLPLSTAESSILPSP